MGNVLLKWKEPASVRLSQSPPERQFTLRKVAAVAASITLVALDVLRGGFDGVSHFVVVPCLMWAFNRVVPTYEISETGIAYRDGHRRLKHDWSNIDWYNISPVETASHLLQIRFSVKKIKGTNFPPAFVFDPQEINRNVVLRILEKHLPHRELQVNSEPKALTA